VPSQNGPHQPGNRRYGPTEPRPASRVPSWGSWDPARGCGSGVVAHAFEFEVSGSSHPQIQHRRRSGFKSRDAQGSGDESRSVGGSRWTGCAEEGLRCAQSFPGTASPSPTPPSRLFSGSLKRRTSVVDSRKSDPCQSASSETRGHPGRCRCSMRLPSRYWLQRA
jgi:hypothetical protein